MFLAVMLEIFMCGLLVVNETHAMRLYAYDCLMTVLISSNLYHFLKSFCMMLNPSSPLRL